MPNADASPATPIELEGVHLSFGGRQILEDFGCRFEAGKITVLLGGSGAGKTTILRLIGGLVRPQRGAIRVAGVDVCGLGDRDLYTVRDKLGMMFQGGALLDSLTIFDNLAFPLREHSELSDAEIRAEVERRLQEVGMEGVGTLLPGQLSGGMVKRAALARAIITKPEILLCDEPFSGLDPISVKRIEQLLKRINRQHGITMLVSSHHLRSTMRMADRLVLLSERQAITGTPEELQESSDPWVREFLNDDLVAEAEDGSLEAREAEALPVLS